MQGWFKAALALLLFFLLLGCEPTEKNEPPGGEAVSYVAANLLGYNNVADTNINWFSVNGYQGRTGGFTCCVSLPEQWQPNMKVEVEWEMDPDPFPKNMPPLGTDQFRSFMKEHETNYRHHKTVVTIPEYQESCGLQVHFLPCQQVKVTVTCHGVEHPDHPIKESFDLPEPAQCSS